MSAHEEIVLGVGKVLVAWAVLAYGWITLQHVATALAIVYTTLQIYILWRDKLKRRNDADGS